jgi:two-component system sensor histidine kinase MprB
VTLRTKIVAALVLLATGATIAIGLFSYAATANQLQAEIDGSLRSAARSVVDQVQRGQRNLFCGSGGQDGPGPALIVCQGINPDGTPALSEHQPTATLPIGNVDKGVLGTGLKTIAWHNVSIDGERYRIETVSLGDDLGAVQIARSLKEFDKVVRSLRNRVLIAALVVVLVAGGIGFWIARQVTRRLTTLTTTAEEVAHTGRLDIAVPVQGTDEAGRLGVAFNEMLTALARSKEDQQRLVQDAGHELRTPLTSLRTNMSVLRRHELEADTRLQVLDDLDSEARELTDLVNELVELATDRSRDEPTEEIALAEIAQRVAQRAQRRSGRAVTVDTDNTVVIGRRQGIERAINNLVDNALKFDERGQPVEIVVREGRVTVLDRGPGVDGADLPHLFDRFFRSVNARSQPGSGLGLAIVRDVAQRHGGTVFAEPREGGGAAIGFTVPVNGATPQS